MSKMKIDTLLELWSESLQQYNASAPYERHSDMYATIDTVTLGEYLVYDNACAYHLLTMIVQIR